MLDNLTKSRFLEELLTKFQNRFPARHPLELELYQVEEGRSTATHEQLSLFFHSPKEFDLGQGTFEIAHEQIGTFQLFLVPVARSSPTKAKPTSRCLRKLLQLSGRLFNRERKHVPSSIVGQETSRISAFASSSTCG